jgi:anti-sigma factor RsiW
MDELYELYLLGVLEPELSAEFDRHIADDCPYCLEKLRQAAVLNAALSGIANPEPLPKSLRSRVLETVRPPAPRRRWSLLVPALSAACALFLALFVWSYSRSNDLAGRLAAALRERNDLRVAVQLFSSPATRTVQFGLAENRPHGRVLVRPTGGLVFVASQLPPLANDRAFELWLVPSKGAPQPAGLLQRNAAGDFIHISRTPVDTARIAALAVSVEPSGGSSAPTTKPFLIVPLGS